MRVLFFGGITLSSDRILDVQIELILKHLIRGDEVVFIGVDDEVFKMQVFQDPREMVYKAYIGIKKFERLLREISKERIVFRNYLELHEDIEIPIFESVEELKKYEYEGLNIGMGCASTLISAFRNHGFDTRDKSAIINQMLISAIRVINTVEFYNGKYNPDLVYILNGRGVTTAPIVLCCRESNINFRTYELLGDINKYDLIENTIPHDISYRSKQIINMWENNLTSYKKKATLAQQFFEANRRGTPIAGESFTQLQRVTEEIVLDRDKEIITFFNSSIDEFASVPGWENYIFLFNDEVEAIESICRYFKKDTSKQFVLRIHPNLMGLDNLQTRNLKKLNRIENLIIFPPESSISSYRLIDISSKVITFGSTIGIEACYFGKTSISLGLSFYINLDVCYIPKDKNQLLDLINTPNLSAKPKENTYSYGYWIVSFGVPFELRGREFPEGYFSLSNFQKVKYFFIKLSSKSFMKKIKSPIHRKRLFRYLVKKISKKVDY